MTRQRADLIALNGCTVGWFLGASALPELARPLLLVAGLIALLVGIALLAMLPAAEAWERWSKAADWRRSRYYASLARERRLRARMREELARADTEIALQGRTLAERDRQIAELSRDLNAAYAEIKSLRGQLGRPSSSTGL